ncbi:IclR family transcriptional regulator [Nocardioides insulae]|uniref:IclR family transcriptional regulator n=1 Tax=Nocardioides insulae TaxID=394734 RepID=UPI000421F92D|nr:IclR family transcriptional regulator [Nocardioides insulae]
MAEVPAAAQTLAVLSYLSRQAAPVPAGLLAQALGIPRSTTYHLLGTMIEAGFVVHYPEDRAYGLGLAAYELGTGYARQEPLQRLARRPLADLSDRCRNSAHLCVLMQREVVYVIEERAPGRPLLITDVGLRLPAHATASGRAILAALPAAQVRALYPSADAFAGGAPNTPSTPSELRRRLVDVRREGVALEQGEVTEGLSSMALAVLDTHDYPVAAVTVTYPEAETSGGRFAEIRHHLEATVRLLTRRVAGRT